MTDGPRDTTREDDASETRELPSCLGWGGVAISADGAQRSLEDFEALPVAISHWAMMPEHDAQTIELCTEFSAHPHPDVRAAALAALETITRRRH